MSANKLVLGDSFNALAKQVENLVEKDVSAQQRDSSFRYASFGMTCSEKDSIKTSFPPHLKQQNNLSSNELIINLINKNN